MSSSSGSTVTRRQLGLQLKRLRENSHMTVQSVVLAKLMSSPKLWRIESGSGATKVGDVRALCHHYGADPQTTEALVTLAQGTTEPGWWEKEYADVIPDEHQMLFGLEAAASRIQVYDASLINGLFQTPEYIMAIHQRFINAIGKTMSRESIDKFVQSRLDRQNRMLSVDSQATICSIHDAATLTRVVGSREIMKAQVERLLEISRSDGVEIRVLPWESGAHAAHGGQFALMDFLDANDPPVVYLESHASANYIETEAQVNLYRQIFKSLVEQSVSLEEFSSYPYPVS